MQTISSDIGNIIPAELDKIMSDFYLNYAYSVNLSRAIPTLLDGLKPVHRRILYGAYELGLAPASRLKKSAALIGHVLGKYHPHGDAAAYEAAIFMSQPWKNNLPLLYISGNMGNISGDAYAARRYTEAQLTHPGISGLRMSDHVAHEPNFDGTENIPKFIPYIFPNLIINGQTGIGCGITVNIPPHNVGEAIDATILVAKNPNATVDDIIRVMPGPDFPTGGKITNGHAIRDAYETGVGIFGCECTYTINKNTIEITEIPFQTSLSNITKTLKEALKKGTISGIQKFQDLTDQSCTNNRVKYHIKVAAGVDPQVLMEDIMSNLDCLRTSVSWIFNAIHDNKLAFRVNLVRYFNELIASQKQIILTKVYNDLITAQTELDILLAIKEVFPHIDDVIAIIRASKSDEEAVNAIMEKYQLYYTQANRIVQTRIIKLSQVNIDTLNTNIEKLEETVAEHTKFVSDPQAPLNRYIEMLIAFKEKYGKAKRRTIILEGEKTKKASTMTKREIRLSQAFEDVDNFITLSNQGMIRRIPTDVYRAQNRNTIGRQFKINPIDPIIKSFYANSNDVIWCVSNKGIIYEIKCGTITAADPTTYGSHVSNFIKMSEGETIVAAAKYEDTSHIAFISKSGLGKVVALTEFTNIAETGIIGAKVNEGDTITGIKFVNADDGLIATTRTGDLVFYPVSDWPQSKRPTFGTTIVKEAKSSVFTVSRFDMTKHGDVSQTYVLSVSTDGCAKLTSIQQYPITKRPTKGIACMLLNPRHQVVACDIVHLDEANPMDIILVTKYGKSVRVPLNSVPVSERRSKGNALVKLTVVDGKPDYVIAATLVPAEE